MNTIAALKEDIERFFRNHISGKTLFTDGVVYSLEGGSMEGVYSDRMVFNDFWSGDTGFGFDMTSITDEKIYEVRDGKRGVLLKDYTGTGTYRYELAARRSTGEFTGYMRHVATTVSDHTMEAVVYGIFGLRFEDGALSWQEEQLLYRDAPAGGGGYRPVAFDASVRLFLEEDKLVFEYLPVYSDYDPVTRSKSVSGDNYPPFISREK